MGWERKKARDWIRLTAFLERDLIIKRLAKRKLENNLPAFIGETTEQEVHCALVLTNRNRGE